MMFSPRKEISSRTGPDRTRHTFALILIIVLSLTTCAGTLNHELVRDDGSILQYVDSVVRGGGPQGLPGSRFATRSGEGYVSGYYRPVVTAGLWLDSLRAGSFPWIFHFTNILLNPLNALMVFFLLRLLIGPFGAAAGSATFAAHPGHVEPVAFGAGPTGLRAALVTLMGVIARVRERKGLSPCCGPFPPAGLLFLFHGLPLQGSGAPRSETGSRPSITWRCSRSRIGNGAKN